MAPAPGPGECIQVLKLVVTAAETVESNKRRCNQLADRIASLEPLISRLQSAKQASRAPSCQAPLKNLYASLKKAERIAADCQGSRIYRVLFYRMINLRIVEVWDELSEFLGYMAGIHRLDLQQMQEEKLLDEDDKEDLEFGRMELLYRRGHLSCNDFINKLIDEQAISCEEHSAEIVSIRLQRERIDGHLANASEKEAQEDMLMELIISLLSERLPKSIEKHVRRKQEPCIPSSCFCSICTNPMLDPVSVEYGHSYCRACIKEWLGRGNRTNPRDNRPLTTTQLVDNIDLRMVVETALIVVEPFCSASRECWPDLLHARFWEVQPSDLPGRVTCRGLSPGLETPVHDPFTARQLSEQAPSQPTIAGDAALQPSGSTRSVTHFAGEAELSAIPSRSYRRAPVAVSPRSTRGSFGAPRHMSIAAESAVDQIDSLRGDSRLPLPLVSGREAEMTPFRPGKFDPRKLPQYEAAARIGDPLAQQYVGLCYEHGLGVPKADMALAQRWYEKSANRGNPFALGHCYYYGVGMVRTRDRQKAIELFRRAAEQGGAAGQFALALCYRKGDGVAVNEVEAVKWCRKAAEQEFAVAQRYLARCYREGWGVCKDGEEAVRWYKRAADQGDVVAMSSLGECLMSGVCVVKNEHEGFNWYRKAAVRGCASAQCSLGTCYRDGVGVTKDERQGVEWYREAARQDHAVAQRELGACYRDGLGVARDEDEAVEWFRAAALQGDSVAQSTLCAYYRENRGAATLKAYSHAAQEGSEQARFALGWCYEHGVGGPKDRAAAEREYRRAKEGGFSPAICNTRLQRRVFEGKWALW